MLRDGITFPRAREAKMPAKQVTAKTINDVLILDIRRWALAGLNWALPICRSIIRVAVAMLITWPTRRIVPMVEEATP